ncbi:MAG TPA: class I SAM-dependent RNA methyltransferase [Desulfobacteria bacterium]|nr:class I SAM-dependent RNA methyltransferase [Desulfobacteria bacterium]
MSKIELIATATFGLEAVVAREVKALGYEDMTVENAKVTFTADEMALCRTNLWLRTADRVLLKMGSFKATTFEELFQQTKALPWADWLPRNANFPVSGKSINSKLFSVPDCQAIVKKAVVEKMKSAYKQEWFDEDGPRYAIEVALLKDEVTLTIDTSGPGLHKRGYRKLTGEAPLKETLAAALVTLGHWFHDRILMDPLCGTGTIPVEAALIGQNIAPGIERNFAAETWPSVPKAIWQQARQEALSLEKRDRKLKIIGTDINEKALSMARYHAKEAGVEDQIHFQCMPLSEVRTKSKYGYIICNPPYGERLGDNKEVEKLYKEMGQLSRALDTWSFYVITAHTGFERFFGRQAARRRKVYNGRIECQYYQYPGPRPPRRLETDSAERPESPESENLVPVN